MAVSSSPTGADLFEAFIDRHGLTLRQVGEQLGVSNVAIFSWKSGRLRPAAEARLLIEKWTGNEVPSLSWLTAEEREHIERVARFVAAEESVAGAAA